MDLPFDTILAARDAIRARKLSVVDLTQAALDAIEHRDPDIGAFNSVFPERALSQAREFDSGQRSGLLGGVPVAIKDNLCTRFGKTTCSSKMLADFHSPYDATVVRKLEEVRSINALTALFKSN